MKRSTADDDDDDDDDIYIYIYISNFRFTYSENHYWNTTRTRCLKGIKPILTFFTNVKVTRI